MTASAIPVDPAAKPEKLSETARAANWLAGAAVILPFLQLIPLDFDRSAPLLLVPALWFGSHQLARGVSHLARGPTWLRWAGTAAVIATVWAVILADQPAPALVAAASWVLLAAGGVLAGQLVHAQPGLSPRLLAGFALGAAAGTLATWFLWWNTGRNAMPLYANPRHLGLHLVGGVIAATALTVRPGITPGTRLGWFVVGCVTWGGMLWAGGRTPVVGVIAGMIAWTWQTQRDQRRRLLACSASMVVVGILLSAIFWSPRLEYGWWHMLSRTSAGISEGTASSITTTRSDFWRETIQRAKAAPWLGHGPDSYRFLTPKLDGQQPHNVALQLWLDLGVVGALPALILLIGALVVGARHHAPPAQPWIALLAVSCAAGMLDGVFYHMLASLPAILAVGICLGGGFWVPTKSTPAFSGVAARVSVFLATVILLFHAWLFHQVAVAPPPGNSQQAQARLLQWFPSTTFGLWRWLDAWQTSEPAAPLAWARWAQTHSAYAPHFHIYAANCLLRENDRAGANRELQAAWRKAHVSAKPSIEAMQKQLGLAAGGPAVSLPP